LFLICLIMNDPSQGYGGFPPSAHPTGTSTGSTHRYFAVKRSSKLKAPVLFFDAQDLTNFLGQQQHPGAPPDEYQGFETMVDAVQYIAASLPHTDPAVATAAASALSATVPRKRAASSSSAAGTKKKKTSTAAAASAPQTAAQQGSSKYPFPPPEPLMVDASNANNLPSGGMMGMGGGGMDNHHAAVMAGVPPPLGAAAMVLAQAAAGADNNGTFPGGGSTSKSEAERENEAWESMFRKLEMHASQYGDIDNISYLYDPKLSLWIREQQRLYNILEKGQAPPPGMTKSINGVLTYKRIQKLRNLGYDFDGKKNPPTFEERAQEWYGEYIPCCVLMLMSFYAFYW
jgi:hypothetical protein